MKILLLTSQYPADDVPKNLTSVVHYLTKEWRNMGVEVVVIHCLTVFPIPIYPILRIFKKILANKVGFFFPVTKLSERNYELDGVRVYRRHILKPLPQHKFFNRSYKKQEAKIVKILEGNSFEPDILVGHWLTPQLKLLDRLKERFDKPTCIVVHEISPILERDYPNRWSKYIERIDLIGYRSKSIKKNFIDRYKVKDNSSFLCYSGVPSKFFINGLKKEFSSPFSFTFVGTLIQRKYPDALIKALNHQNIDLNWNLNYVGEGPMKSTIRSLTADYKCEQKVNLFGRVKRKEVEKILEKTTVFVMISENEAFGLVYLEAMAKGCITIGSRNEGMDGIIKDGFNGFLCNSGDWVELQSIFEKILKMDEAELRSISERAIQTAEKFSDKSVAISYLNELKAIAQSPSGD